MLFGTKVTNYWRTPFLYEGQLLSVRGNRLSSPTFPHMAVPAKSGEMRRFIRISPLGQRIIFCLDLKRPCKISPTGKK